MKVLCDRCGKVLSNSSFLKEFKVRVGGFTWKIWDVCDNCLKQLKAMLEEEFEDDQLP